MSDFADVNATLLANKQKREASSPVAQPAPEPSVTQPLVQTIPPVAPAPAEAAPVTKKPEEAVPPTTSTTPPAVEARPEISLEEDFQWDKEIPEISSATVADGTSAIDYKKIGSALSLEVDSEKDFLAKISERLTKLKELEALSSDSVPDQLKQAIEVAKKGGDWLSFTGVTAVDFSKTDPVMLFEKEYERANIHRFKGADGQIDWAKFDEEVDSIAPGIKVLQGNQIKAALVQKQESQKASIIAQAAVQRETFQKNLGEAVKELPTLLPKEQFGITIEPKHTSYLYEGINSGSLIKKHLGDIDPAVLSKLDSKKLMKTIAIAEFGKNISELRFKQGEVAGKKAILVNTQNPQLNGPSYLPRPEEPTVDVKTSADRLKEAQLKVKPKNSL